MIQHKFQTRFQGQAEPADQFITDLKLLAKDCEYGNLTNDLVKDRIICGVYSKEVREKLLQEADLTLVKVTEILRAVEMSKQRKVKKPLFMQSRKSPPNQILLAHQ